MRDKYKIRKDKRRDAESAEFRREKDIVKLFQIFSLRSLRALR